MKHLRLAVIANIVTLSQMPYTSDYLPCTQVFSFAIGIEGNLHPAVMLYPVKSFFHNHCPLQALTELIKMTLSDM